MGKRELSCFLCQELLNEFLLNRLDNKRREAVNTHLSSCEACHSEKEKVKKSHAYLQEYSQLKIHEEYKKELLRSEPFSDFFLRIIRWDTWPDPMKWVTESVLIAATIALVLGTVSQTVLYMKKHSINDQGTDVAFVEDLPPENISEAESQEENIKQMEAALAADSEDEVPSSSPAQKSSEVSSTEASSEESAKTAARKGFVYRGTMSVPDAEDIAEAVIGKIKFLGGAKAGEVPLGWKQPGGRYFHFAIAEKDYEELTRFLSAYGKIRLSKEPHRRVMPKGIVRIILFIGTDRRLKVKKTKPVNSISNIDKSTEPPQELQGTDADSLSVPQMPEPQDEGGDL